VYLLCLLTKGTSIISHSMICSKPDIDCCVIIRFRKIKDDPLKLKDTESSETSKYWKFGH
jgi:hypothetical protein